MKGEINLIGLYCIAALGKITTESCNLLLQTCSAVQGKIMIQIANLV